MNTEELAWAAGFFDGEGSAFVQIAKWNGVAGTYSYPTIRMTVAQSGEHAVALLQRFQAAVGGRGKIVGPHIYANGKYLPKWDWKCQGLIGCQEVYAKLWRFLGPRKKEQIFDSASVVLNHMKNRPITHPRGGAGHRVKG